MEFHDWNFEGVPDDELVACCYWECARESEFILDVRRRCLDPKWNQMTNLQFMEYCGSDLEKIKSIGYASEVFIRGFMRPVAGVLPDATPLAPGRVRRLTGSFPKAWQELTRRERVRRKQIGTDIEGIRLVPFRRGLPMYARDIADFVKSQQPNAEMEIKHRKILPSLFWQSGREVTVVEINWASFTNEQILNHFRKWLKANRPKDSPGPNRQGKKTCDWRLRLVRLGVLRLLSRYSALDLVARDRFPEVWKSIQFSGRKWRDITKWHEARREARAAFHKFFPFLPKGELPLSWHRAKPAK